MNNEDDENYGLKAKPITAGIPQVVVQYCPFILACKLRAVVRINACLEKHCTLNCNSLI